MDASFISQKAKKFLFGVIVFAAVASAGLGVTANFEWSRAKPLVAQQGFSEPDIRRGKILSTISGDFIQSGRRNQTNPEAPAPGSAYFETPRFADLNNIDEGTPGTRAAHKLLVRSHLGNEIAAQAQYDGTTRKGFDEYKRAVFLNTVAVIRDRDSRLLEKTTFVRFYDGRKKHALEYGIVLSGLTPNDLARADMRPSGFLGTTGRRSPKKDAIASLEATWQSDGKSAFAFDVDLYNPKADPVSHTAEVKFNDKTQAATHPADVSRALVMRGIVSGVITDPVSSRKIQEER